MRQCEVGKYPQGNWPGACAPLWLIILLVSAAGSPGWAQTTTVSAWADADAFVRSLAPTNNYGAGGALSVSGSAAVNGTGDQNGLFDTLMKFPMSNVVASLDGALGGEDWIVTETRLVVTEMAAPDNSIFNRGVGAFEIRWVASDDWIEGTGTPKAPTNNGVAWQDVPSILNSNLDVSLGTFTNAGVNGQISFSLALEEQFIANLRQGGEVGLYLTAQSAEVGFTFNSRDFGNTNAQPFLTVTAVANPRPRIDAITLAGTNALVSFGMVTNWTYTLQWTATLLPPGPETWSNLLTIPPQAAPTNIVYLDGITNGGRFYRLVASP